MTMIESIGHEHQFKTMCDALLRYEMGPLFQTYGAKGKDKGIDADFFGKHGDGEGRWVFQYKFIGPYIDDERARRALLRSFIRGRQRSTSKVEFEKAAALQPRPDIYVIVTNRDVTVDLVEKLRRALSLQFPCRLLVWDRSTLSVFLRDRGFLARTWDGTREAHCRSEVVAPLFQALNSFLPERSPATPPRYGRSPLWPVELESVDRPIPGDSFVRPISWSYGWHRYSAAEQIALVEAHPLFEHTRTIAFPNSLRDIKLLRASMAALYERLVTLLDEVAASLRTNSLFVEMPQLTTEDSMAIAYTALETAWGFPSYYPSVTQQHIQLGRRLIYQGPIPENFVKSLDQEIRKLRERGVPKDIEALKRTALSRLRRSWDRLWSAAELGIDSERAPQQTNRPALKEGNLRSGRRTGGHRN